ELTGEKASRSRSRIAASASPRSSASPASPAPTPMPRPTDIAQKATPESRRKGALAANARRRELSLSLRERIARQLEQRAEERAGRFAAAAGAGDYAEWRDGLRAAAGEIARAVREDEELRPERLVAIPAAAFLELVQALPAAP